MSKLGICFVPGIFWKFLGRLLMGQEIRHLKAPDKVGIVNLPKHFRRLFIHHRWLYSQISEASTVFTKKLYKVAKMKAVPLIHKDFVLGVGIFLGSWRWIFETETATIQTCFFFYTDFIYTWNPNDPCFMERALFWRVQTSK